MKKIVALVGSCLIGTSFVLPASASQTGSVIITMPSMPESGVSDASLSMSGMGQTFNKTLRWNEQWALTELTPGTYTFTASEVNNTSHQYQAIPRQLTVKANESIHIEPNYLSRPKSWDSIKHVVIIMFENTSLKATLKQPYFNSLLKQGASLSQYYAVAHPSQPNYIALTSGQLYGVKDDKNKDINAQHIGNLFNAKKLTWKSYAESYPGKCFQGAKAKTYYRKHEPFISYNNVRKNATECAKIVPATEFFTDLAAHKLPSFSFYVPDINNDGHDKGVAYADRWLEKTFSPLFADKKVLSDTLFILTFDEDDYQAKNNVYMVFLGAGVKPGATSSVKYDHYSSLKTIESIFQLSTLGQHDTSAKVIDGIWNP